MLTKNTSHLTQALIDLLQVRQLEDFIFQGQCTQIFGSHLFGGQLLGQALVAASKTLTILCPAHSLHGYFLRSGVTTQPILYRVTVLQEGKSFHRRQVDAIQNGEVIFTAMLSFAVPEDGLDYHIPAPTYPLPETLFSEQEHKQHILKDVPSTHQALFSQPFHLQVHPVHFSNPYTPEKRECYAEYFKTHQRIATASDDMILHQAIAAYHSDYNLLSISLLNHGLSYISKGIMSASLDHAMYFHHPLRADEWILYDLNSPTSNASRGLNYGQMWQNGKLVCSTIQESLMRQY